MDEPKVDNQKRKPSAAQWAGGGLIGAILLLQPVKDLFYTRDEATLQSQRVERMELAVMALEARLTEKMNRNTDKIIERLGEAEARTVKTSERLEARIDKIENKRR